jgi:hypothetical protein
MRCKACGSQNLGRFNGELAIHFQGLENINEITVFVFPKLVICRDCGLGEFIVPEKELSLLTKNRGRQTE